MKSLKEDSLYASSMQSSMLMPVLRGDTWQAYAQQFQWTFRHEIDWQRFQEAWQFVFQRHDTFYHRFEFTSEGILRIKGCLEPQFQLDRKNWSRFSTKNQKTKLRAFLKEDRVQGFQFENQPLCRLNLIRLSSNHHELIWTSQHSLFDGRARLILIKEFIDVYHSLISRKPIQLPKAPRFGKYLEWCQNQDWNGSLNFWKQELAEIDDTTPLFFGLDLKPGKTAGISHALHGCFLSAKLTEKLHVWSKTKKLSLNVLVQAAWGLYLSRTSGKDTIVFAAPRACRKSNVQDAANTVGLFVNTVPVVLRMKNSSTVGEFVQQVRENWIRMREHENTPIDQIKQCSQIPASKPLFSSMVGYEKYQLNQLIKSQSGSHYQFQLTGFTDLPLVLQMQDGKKIRVEIAYDKNQFSTKTIKSTLSAFETILAQLIRNPEADLKQIQLLNASERARIKKLSRGPQPNIPNLPVHRIFENIVKRYPDKVAVRCERRSLTYKQLNAQGNKLARFLKSKGVKEGTHVGLFFEKSEYIFISQLAILKAGGVYVHYDVEYPKDRLNWMVKDAKPSLILSTSNLRNEANGTGLKAIYLDNIRDQWEKFSARNLPGKQSKDSAAYIMYTSGSTGRPKGVIVPHSGITRLVIKTSYVKLSQKVRTLQLAPISFDASTFEIWAPLLNGGTCVLYPERVPSIMMLEEMIHRESINTLWLTASLFNFIVDAEPKVLKGIEQLLVGGEALSPGHIKQAQGELSKTRLINGYGPTENTTFSCCYRIPKKHPANRPVPIGPPISHSTGYVLDKSLQMVPNGTSGELYVGGLGVALGYLNNPQLTRQRFLDNPYGSKGDPVLYRTGDRVFQRSSGDIEYLERFDDQVKIRGFRIEPREVQANLVQIQGVKDGAVLVRTNNHGENELAAYIVLNSDSGLNESLVKRRLSSRLPSYMIPSSLEILDKIPLTSNGKVDRAALLSGQSVKKEKHSNDSENTTKTQKLVSRIWKEELSKSPIGIDENFFEAGGHSLTAASLIHKIQSEFSVKLTYSEFQRLPTLRYLAAAVSEKLKTRDYHPTLQPFTVQPLQLKPLRELGYKWRMAFYPEIVRPKGARSLLICRAALLDGKLDRMSLRQAVNRVINLHDSLRTHVIKIDGKFFEKIEPKIELKIPLIDLSNFRSSQALHKAKQFFYKECAKNVSIYKSPPMRIHLLKLERLKHFLTIVLHHGIADGTSLEIFYKQLSQAYSDLVNNRPSSLVPPKFGYNQYVRSLERWYMQGNLARIQKYWSKQVRNLKPIEYPFMRKKLPKKVLSNLYEHFEFQKDWTDRIKQFTESHSISDYVFFATVIKWMVARYTGQLDNYLTTPVDTREGQDQKNMIGLLGNTMLIRNKVMKRGSFVEAAKEFRTALVDTMRFKYNSVRSIEIERNKKVLNIFKPSGQLQVVKGPDTGESLSLEGIQSTFIPRDKQIATVRLGFVFRSLGDRMLVSFQYPPEIFVKHGIDRMKANFQQFIQIVLKNPQISLDQLPDLSYPQAYKKPVSKSELQETILRSFHPIKSQSNAPCRSPSSTKSQVATSARLEETQKTISQKWGKIFGKAPASLDENFFEAGGHSLLASKLIFEIQSTWPINLPYNIFVKHGSVRSLSKWIEKHYQKKKKNNRALPLLVKPTHIKQLSSLSRKWRTVYLPEIKDRHKKLTNKICRNIDLDGNLKPHLLQKSIIAVINLNERLRTHAVEIDGQYFEEIRPNLNIDVPLIDLTNRTSQGTTRQVKNIYKQECAKDLHICDDQLFRFKILKLDKQKHILIFIIHHAVADGTSLELIYKQIGCVYNDLLNRRPISVKPSKYSFKQVADSVDDWLAAGNEKKAVEYWENLLKQVDFIPFPFYKQSLPKEVQWNSLDRYNILPKWDEKLSRYIDEHSVSKLTFFTTVFKVLTARYTGRLDCPVSSSVDTRPGPEEISTIGDFAAVIMSQTQLNKNRAISKQMVLEQAAWYASLQHKQVGIYTLESQVNDSCNRIHKKFGQLLIINGPDTGEALMLDGVTTSSEVQDTCSVRTRLGLIFREINQGTQITFQHVPEIFLKHGVDRFIHNFQKFLTLILDNPSITLTQLPDLTDPSSYKRPLSAWEKKESILRKKV